MTANKSDKNKKAVAEPTKPEEPKKPNALAKPAIFEGPDAVYLKLVLREHELERRLAIVGTIRRSLNPPNAHAIHAHAMSETISAHSSGLEAFYFVQEQLHAYFDGIPVSQITQHKVLGGGGLGLDQQALDDFLASGYLHKPATGIGLKSTVQDLANTQK